MRGRVFAIDHRVEVLGALRAQLAPEWPVTVLAGASSSLPIEARTIDALS